MTWALHQGGSPPKHAAYLDDLHLFVDAVFTEQSQQYLHLILDRLAAAGLELNLRKCMAVARAGMAFSPQDRYGLQSVGIRWVDSTTPEQQRGFAPLGVYIGTPAYVELQLCSKLTEDSLWRLSWHLTGLAEQDLSAAYSIFRGSLT